ncbi:MAG: hypothetical protein HC790_12145 [Acaryochloridaceae cyanobacterium CSU_3_4]|nr:hypothetical protein [Acaryochloridaceae cyanobacterium CSU_3_4]
MRKQWKILWGASVAILVLLGAGAWYVFMAGAPANSLSYVGESFRLALHFPHQNYG